MRTLFGFGSLLDKESLRETAPSATTIRPSYITGFLRDFSVWDPVGFKKGTYAGQGFWALNVTKSSRSDDLVNGIVFNVDEQDMSALFEREKEYELLTTNAYDYATSASIEVSFFSAPKVIPDYSFDSVAQEQYLRLCLRGATSYGSDFYETFLRTTFIKGRNLREIPELRNILG